MDTVMNTVMKTVMDPIGVIGRHRTTGTPR